MGEIMGCGNDSTNFEILLKSVAEELGEEGMHWYRCFDTLKVCKSLALPLGATVLDIGCGFGHLSLTIKRLGYSIYAVDMNMKKFGKRLRKHDITILRCEIENYPLPFGDKNFDCVLFTEVIEHLDPRRLHFVLSEIHRILKRGGTLLLTTPNQASFQNAIRLLLGRRIIVSPDHIREYVLEELVELLRRTGFSTYRKSYLPSYDKSTSIGGGRNTSANHVLKRRKFHRNKTNIAGALLFPLKILVPYFRSLILLLAYKEELS